MSARTWMLVVVAAVSFAATAVPAFTADSGSVTATVDVERPPAPCITLSGTGVDFGTLPLSDPAAASTPLSDALTQVRVSSCSTGGEVVSLAATSATTASGGTWTVPGLSENNTCTFGPNVYMPSYGTSSPFVGAGRLYSSSFRSLPAFAPGGGTSLIFRIQMPCRGSVGAGEQASMTFQLLAAVT